MELSAFNGGGLGAELPLARAFGASGRRHSSLFPSSSRHSPPSSKIEEDRGKQEKESKRNTQQTLASFPERKHKENKMNLRLAKC